MLFIAGSLAIGGPLTDEERAEALGAFLLRKSGYRVPNGAEIKPAGEGVWVCYYKGREWKAMFEPAPIEGSQNRLYFDFMRPAPEIPQ